MQTTRNSSAANAAPSRNIHIFFIVHSPLMAFMPFCLSIITILLDSLLVLSVKDIFCFSCTLQHKNRPGFHCGNRGGSFCLLVLLQALTQLLAGVLNRSLSGCQNCRVFGSGKTHFSTFTHAMLSISSDSHENK